MVDEESKDRTNYDLLIRQSQATATFSAGEGCFVIVSLFTIFEELSDTKNETTTYENRSN